VNAPESLAPDARVLVIHVARIGDTLLVTPGLRALKRHLRSGQLDVLAHPGRRDLFAGLSYVDELGAITAKRAWWRGRFGKRYDAAIVYGHDAPLIRYAARVARRVVAFEQHDEALNSLLWKSIPTSTGMHAVHERLLLPAALGVETEDFRLAYVPTPRELTFAKYWLVQHEAWGRPLAGFQVASFATKSYRDWPLAHFTELGRRLLARHPDMRILVFGDNQSREPADALVRELGPRVICAAGAFKLRETAAVMAHLDLYVGVDTGPTHLAGALRVPMVALYHCRHRGRYLAPLQHNRLRVIEHPATDDQCSATMPMSDIAVDPVWSAVESLLGGERSSN
jgi:heptosyltransferase III